MNTISRSRWITATAAAVLALLATLAHAQPIYRIVGPDGKVSFSDRPPVGNEKVTPLGPGGRAVDGASGGGELSFELRQLMSRYPVTLYTGDDCEPCVSGRSLLSGRGIPYTERTVKTSADLEVLQRLGGGATVPMLTIGGQRLKGFSSTEWNQYLDAAGYPASSRLPSGYRNPPPLSLAPPVPADAPAAAPQPPAAEPVPAAPPPPPPPANPSGITF
jgi:glutaredoxin